jgi:hypothetical protein
VAVSNPTAIIANGQRATQAAFTTASVDWSVYNGKLIVFNIVGQRETAAPPANPTISGGGVTWTIESRTPLSGTFSKRTYVGVGYTQAGTTEALTITWPDNMLEAAWTFFSVDGAETGANGTEAFSQVQWGVFKSGTATTGTQEFGNPFTDLTNNGCFLLGMRVNPNQVANGYDTGFTEFQGFQLDSTAFFLWNVWKSGGASLQPSVTWSNGSDYYISFVEIRASGTPRSVFDNDDILIGASADSTSNIQNYTLGTAWQPAARSVVIYAVLSRDTGGSSGATGVTAHGITFEKIGSNVALGNYTLTAWRGKSDAPTSTQVSVTHADAQTGCTIIGIQLQGTFELGPNGVNAVVQVATGTASANNLTLTLNPGAAPSAVLGFFGVDVNMSAVNFVDGIPSNGAAFVNENDGQVASPGGATPNAGMFVEWKREFSTTIGLTQSATTTMVGIALEIAAMPVAASFQPKLDLLPIRLGPPILIAQRFDVPAVGADVVAILTPGALTLSGQTLTTSIAVVAVLTPGTVTLAGQTVNASRTTPVTPGAVTLAGQSLTTSMAVVATLTPGALSLEGQSLLTQITVPVTPGALTLAGQTLIASAAVTATLTPGGLTLTGQTLQASLNTPVTPGTLSLTGQALSVLQIATITPGALTLAGQTLATQLLAVLSSGTLTLAGQTVTTTVSTGPLGLPVKGPTRAEPLRDPNRPELIGVGANSATEV